jgi:hypothetical protein
MGYIYPTHLEFKEAISAHDVPYYQRPKLMAMLKAAERKEFHALVITEVRALSRRGAGEVFVIYDTLQKAGIGLETLNERFSDDPMGELVLGFKAHYAKIERQLIHARMERGKADRILIGHAPNGHPKPAYGYLFVDTDREVKAQYAFNHTVIYVDAEGNEWSEYRVCKLIFSLALERVSLLGICRHLTEIGIPCPMKGYRKIEPRWHASSIRRILTNPIYMGDVWCNKERKEGSKYVTRPKSEWILLPSGTASAIITPEDFVMIQKYLQWNKEDALRSNKHPADLGILRAKFCRCGICGASMYVNTPAILGRHQPQYMCRHKGHNTTITVSLLDKFAWECITEVITHPEWVRSRIEDMRAQIQPQIDVERVTSAIADIDTQMQNLFALAQHASTQKTIDSLGIMMQQLEKQQLDAEALLFDAADDQEERAMLEQEIQGFETWAAQARVLVNDPNWQPSYEEKRNAVRALGVIATVYPASGNYPYRYKIDITVPEIMKKLNSDHLHRWSCGPWEVYPRQGVDRH